MLRSVISEPERLRASDENGSALGLILEKRFKTLSNAAERLRLLADTCQLTQPLGNLFGSFVHLHVNRLGGANELSEETILSLLLRTRESLEKAPVTKT